MSRTATSREPCRSVLSSCATSTASHCCRSVGRAGFAVVATGSALVLALTVVAPASGSHGKVTVTLGEPLLTAPRVSIKDPVDNHCYTVKEIFPNAPEGSTFSSVGNHATTPINA